MEKKKKLRNKSPQHIENSLQYILPRTKKTLFQKFSTTLTILLSLIGLISSVLGLYSYFSPKVLILKCETINPLNPFENPFQAHNIGNVNVLDFHHMLQIKNIIDIKGITYRNAFLDPYPVEKTRINKGDKYIISINYFQTPDLYIKSADVAISYSFKVPFFFHKFEDSASFKLFRKASGEYVWLETN